MAFIPFIRISEWWKEILTTKADPRVKDLFLMQSFVPGTIVIVFYLIVVLTGRKWMGDKRPFNIQFILIVYNLSMVILSGYLFYEFMMAGWLAGYSLGCQLPDYSNTPEALRMVKVCWLFYISKFIELLDTIFFILRKKFNQVTFLHVFHHAIMPFTWWFGVKFVAGGLGTFHSTINSFIHFMMYLYYGLASMGPKMQKYLWWKKYMTSMQLIQFTLVMIHTSQLLFIDCDYPMIFAWIIYSYSALFFVLFFKFYQKTYVKEQNDDKKNENGITKIDSHLNGFNKTKEN